MNANGGCGLFRWICLSALCGLAALSSAAAADLRPGLKVVFATGYGDEDPVVAGGVQLGKPYERDQLAEVLGAASS